jgi:hypothetical protein
MARANQAMARARAKTKVTQHVAVQRAGLIVTSAALAEIEQHVPPTILKIPTKIWIAGAAYIFASLAKGSLSKALIGAADGAAAVYAYKAAYNVKSGKESPLIAGEAGYIESV